MKKIIHFFQEYHLIPLVFIAKYLFFFHSSSTLVKVGTFRWAWTISKMIFMVFWWILVGWTNWIFFFYVHLCFSMGDILIIQNKIVGWKLEKCSCMLQYGWYFDKSKDFGGVRIWNMSIYVYLCCSMGDMLIIQRILVGWQFEHVHLCPFVMQYGRYFDNSNKN